MMELGATVCTPKSPRCAECPLSQWCRARKLGIAAELPDARSKRATVKITVAAAVLLDPRGQTLLVRYSDKDGDLFSHMWQFPALEIRKAGTSELTRHLRERFGVILNGTVAALKSARHAVTYRNVRVLPFLARVTRLPDIAGGKLVLLSRAGELPISNLTRKIVDAAIAGVNGDVEAGG